VRLLLRRSKDDRDGVAEFHDVVHEDFHKVSARDFKFDLGKDSDVSGVERGVLEDKSDFAFAQDAGLVRADETDAFSELADAGRPAVEEAELERDDWNLRDANEVNDADENEVAGDFLADFFTEE
jgi:hypothetical protein